LSFSVRAVSRRQSRILDAALLVDHEKRRLTL